MVTPTVSHSLTPTNQPDQLSLSPQMQDTYSRLVTGLWTNVSPGQEVLIVGDQCHTALMERIQAAAISRGASAAFVEPRSFNHERELVTATSEGSAYQSHFARLGELASRVAAVKGCFIRLEGRGEPDLFEGLDGSRLNALEGARSAALKPIQDLAMRGEIKRCVIAAPTLGWAKKVYPDREPVEAYRALEGVIAETCYLSSGDPEREFLAEDAALEGMRERLKALDIKSLRFIDNSNDTDFSVALTSRSKWLGGVKQTTSGETFYANVPIGELFSTADWRTAQGIVSTTMPGKFSGVTVRDLKFKFENGEVSDFECDPSKRALMEAFFADRTLRRIGEIALASVNSRLGRNDCFFDVILFDEKMRCHFAFGEAYLTCIERSAELMREAAINPAIYAELGINYPVKRHVDVMISQHTTSVWGTTGGGRTVLLLDNGDWSKVLRG